MNWRELLIELPARCMDYIAQGYVLLLAGGSIAALVTAALWAALWALGYPLP